MTTFPAEPLAILLSELLRVDDPARHEGVGTPARFDAARPLRPWVTLERGSRCERPSPAALGAAGLGSSFGFKPPPRS